MEDRAFAMGCRMLLKLMDTPEERLNKEENAFDKEMDNRIMQEREEKDED